MKLIALLAAAITAASAISFAFGSSGTQAYEPGPVLRFGPETAFVAPTVFAQDLPRYRVWLAQTPNPPDVTPARVDQDGWKEFVRKVTPSATRPVVAQRVEVGGNSWQLAATLQAISNEYEGDLASADVVAATGTVDSEGNVGAVSGVIAKAQSAIAAGASVLLVPSGQAPAPVAGLRIAEVADAEEAVAFLCDLGADSAACKELTR